MTKPTGRPRGRPKTKEYVTLMARFPQELADRLDRYMARKQQTVSDVLRDGVLMLLQDDDDAYRPFVSDRKASVDIMSDTKEEEEEPPDVQTDIVYDIRRARQRKRAQPGNVPDKKEEAEAAPNRKAAIMSDKKKASAKKKQAKQPARRAKRS